MSRLEELIHQVLILCLLSGGVPSAGSVQVSRGGKQHTNTQNDEASSWAPCPREALLSGAVFLFWLSGVGSQSKNYNSSNSKREQRNLNYPYFRPSPNLVEAPTR